MLRNYFTIAWRTLLNNRLYTIINIIGLTIGIASCLVIYLIVSFEMSFNRSVPDSDRIYRVYTNFSGENNGTNRGVSTAVQSAVATQFTGLEVAAPFHTQGWKVKVPGPGDPVTFDTEMRIALVSPEFFSLVSGYKWVQGAARSLGQPNQVVLTVDRALKYFGTSSPELILGKELLYHDSLVVTVAGIVNPPIFNHDFDFTEFISKSSIEVTYLKDQITLNDWESTNSNTQLWIKLAPSTSVSAIEEQLKVLDQEERKHSTDNTWTVTYKLQPLSDLHFNSSLGIFDSSRPAASRSMLTTLSIVAVILLLLASINFVNLETARAFKRSREVGIRKVMGSTRSQLIGHFLAQSILLTLAAVVVAIPLAELSLIFFYEFVPPGLQFSLLEPINLMFLAGILLVVGVLSGLYPAFVLSSFRPADALKSQGYSANPSRAGVLRKGLIVFQFASAQLLIIGTLVVGSQIDYMLRKDLGFAKEAILHINPPRGEKEEKRFALKNELERIPAVERLTLCQSPPATKGYSSNELIVKANGTETRKSVIRKFGDPNYLNVYGIQLVAGRNLTPNHKTEILVNEAFLREFGLSRESALGQQVEQGNGRNFVIVGVMRDYHVFSLRAPYTPVYMSGWEEDLYGISVKLTVPGQGARNFTPALVKLEEAWKKVYPDHKFKYDFVDETLRNFYLTEQRISTLSGTAMSIAILISCLGLFGLASYMSIQRAKEVGIRKVLGATAHSILVLLSGDFMRLVGIAFLVAVPPAWYGASKFLENYAFHVELGPSVFVYAGLSALLLAFATVSYQALKTSFTNPVESLRTE